MVKTYNKMYAILLLVAQYSWRTFLDNHHNGIKQCKYICNYFNTQNTQMDGKK